MYFKKLFALIFLLVSILTAGENNWKVELEKKINEFGHRNWIVVADMAYPKQSATAIQTIYTAEDHFAVLDYVLKTIAKADHVEPIVWLDEELDHVPEKLVPGMDKTQEKIADVLKDANVKKQAHLETISNLDEASKLFNVLVLKTNMIQPYTSVFLELDCAYWNGPMEEQMRKNMKKI